MRPAQAPCGRLATSIKVGGILRTVVGMHRVRNAMRPCAATSTNPAPPPRHLASDTALCVVRCLDGNKQSCARRAPWLCNPPKTATQEDQYRQEVNVHVRLRKSVTSYTDSIVYHANESLVITAAALQSSSSLVMHG